MSQIFITLSEAVETVYAVQKRYAPGLDKKWVEAQLKSFAALGLIKFKEEPSGDYFYIRNVVKDSIKTVIINNVLINRIGDKLKEKCMVRFGSCWSDVDARMFARIAITEYELEKANDEISSKKDAQIENVLIEARKLSTEYVKFDFNHPANTISRMSRIIGRLLEIIERHEK